jgi:hypothetical protein
MKAEDRYARGLCSSLWARRMRADHAGHGRGRCRPFIRSTAQKHAPNEHCLRLASKRMKLEEIVEGRLWRR